MEATKFCTHCTKDANCEICKRTTSTRARSRLKKRTDDVVQFTKYGNLVTSAHKILIMRNESRCGHGNALIAQDEYTCRIRGYPMKRKDTSETTTCLQMCLPPSEKPGRTFTNTSKEFVKTCQDYQWNHDTSTSRRSESNGRGRKRVQKSERGHHSCMCSMWPTR